MKSKPIVDILETLSDKAFGRSRQLSLAGNGCVACGKPATEFSDELSRKEYAITGYCQSCQDSFFTDDEE